MKRPVLQFLLGVCYTVMVAFLLFLQIRVIGGQLQRAAALFGVLLLVIPLLVILWLYLRIKNGPEEQKDKKNLNDAGRNFEAGIAEYDLSEREKEVAWLLYRGYTNRQIAEELYIAESTVKKHASHIYEKLNISGKKELKDLFT